MHTSGSWLTNGSGVSVVILLLAGCSGGNHRADGGAGSGGGGGGGSTGGGGGGSTGGGGGSTGGGAVNPAVKDVIDSCAWLTGCLNTEDSVSAAPGVTLSACNASWVSGNEYPWAAAKACVAAQPTSCSAFRQCLIGRNAICVGNPTTEWTSPVWCADGTRTCSTNSCAGPCSADASTCIDATHQSVCFNHQMSIRDCSKIDFGARGGPGTGVCTMNAGPLGWCDPALPATGTCAADGTSCEGGVSVACANGLEYRRDCAAIGQVCSNAGCVLGTACGEEFGMCSGNTYQGCFAGSKFNVDCVALGGACGINRAGRPGCVFPEGTGGTTGDGGTTDAGSDGAGGTGGPELKPDNLISDFEQTETAIVVMAGNPTRNGVWFTYNDDDPKGTDATCVQTPPAVPGMPGIYATEAPPTVRPGSTGALALHAKWSGCAIWGAGIGASLSMQPRPDAAAMQMAYDVGQFTGVTFWAMATAGSDTALRLKFTMTDETLVQWDGLCVESATTKCNDDYGELFNLPPGGSWQQFTVKWSDPPSVFRQEGWGTSFPWNPQHVLSIQIQSVHAGVTYDFWIDDFYFIN